MARPSSDGKHLPVWLHLFWDQRNGKTSKTLGKGGDLVESGECPDCVSEKTLVGSLLPL